MTQLEDDASEDRGTVNTGQSSLTIGRNFLAGVRFRGVAIPRGARITSAVLNVYPAGRVKDPITVLYRGELSAQATPFTSTSNNLSSRSRTRTSVVETPPAWVPGEYASSPNLAGVIEEVVNQPGWQSGNPLVLFIEDQGSSGSRRISSVESGASTAVTLRIQYSTQ